ncbi:MAG: hypothetical protein R2793_02255 [Flavobacteriaceae bacterium]
MKRLLILLLLCVPSWLFSQQDYTINGETVTLYSAVEGPLTLLWNTENGAYHYFIKKGNEITELKNTKANGTYQEEYKATLRSFTGNDTSKVKFTKADLVKAIDTYNAQNDPAYISQATPVQLKTRLGVFAGMSNYPYFVNPDNTLLPQFGAELEIIDDVKLKRHSIAVLVRQILGNNDYDFSSTQLSLNYRFKFVKSESLELYINTKIADYVYVKQNVSVEPDVEISGSGAEFQAPFAFGLGGDIALGNGYITLLYQDVFALNLNDNGNFPVDFVVGYKWNL